MVVNIHKIKKDWEQDPDYVYIGRNPFWEEPSIFGNPIIKNDKCPVCGQTHVTNGSTLKCYEKYLYERLLTDADFRDKFLKLKGKKLVCFCKPNKCHGDILEKYLNLI